jgi:hypothetical protein
MWCPSYTPDYFSLNDILATEERVPMVSKADLPQLGFLDQVKLNALLPSGALFSIYKALKADLRFGN